MMVVLLCAAACAQRTEIAAVAGAPAFINIAAAFRHDPVMLRISGMYFEKYLNGIQFNFGMRISAPGEPGRFVSVLFASSQDEGCDWSYAGAAVDFYHPKRFVQFGLAVPVRVRRGDFDNISLWPVFQLGFILSR